MDEETESCLWQDTSDDGIFLCTYKIDIPDFPYDIESFTLRYSYKQDTVSLLDIDNRKVCLNVSVGFIRARDKMTYQAYGELIYSQIESILAGKPVDLSDISNSSNSSNSSEKRAIAPLDISDTPIRHGTYISFTYRSKHIPAFKINKLILSLFCKRCTVLNIRSIGGEGCDVQKDTKSIFPCVKCTGNLSVDSSFHLVTPEGANPHNLLRIECTGIYGLSIREVLFNSMCSNCNSISVVEIDKEFFCPCGNTLLIRKDPVRPYKEVQTQQNKPEKIKGDLSSLMKKGGTCEHYKKSSRIFIFPCCNGRYACDICHDKSETHKGVRASRMVCGKCGSEGPVGPVCSSSSCQAALIGQSSSFWEGGKGSRNKLTMSKKDSKKYSRSSK